MSTKWQYTGLGCVFIFLAAAGILGCDTIDDELNAEVLKNGEAADDDHVDFTPVDDEITFRQVAPNGVEPNGFRMNGFRMNGTVLNSILRLNSVMSNLQITSGSLLSAYDSGSASTKVGAQLADMTFNLGFDPLNTGVDSPKKVKIKGVVQSSLQSDVYFYNVENEIDTNEYEPACLDGNGNPTDAIPLKKAWDPDTGARIEQSDAITWACRGAALAKAVEWGYRPWVSAAMEDAHAAAARMIRADYCGDGQHHTSNGNPIDVSDKWGIQNDETSWGIEAVWGPDGALCLNTPRKLYHPRTSLPCAASLPYCTTNGLSNGTPITGPAQISGGLLMTRVVPNNNT